MASNCGLKLFFEIYGLITSREFQLAKTYIERLRSRIPHEYDEPHIIPMLDLDWNLFLTKVDATLNVIRKSFFQIRRQIGGEKLWTLKKKVVIFKNDELLGDEEDLLEFIGYKYKLTIFEEFEAMGAKHFIKYIQQQKEFGNTFVYFTIAVDNRIIGTMLFELYAVAVPNISNIFVKRCKKKVGGYSGTCIQRIAWPSWIQCGGWHLTHHKVGCENYSIPHNKRGVLSMCNNGKHRDNYTQFFITLEPTSWMDYKYVAFGQLVHGDDVLRTLQSIPTRFEEPLKKIDIVKSGELDLCLTFDSKEFLYLKDFLASKDPITGLHADVTDVRDCSSELVRKNYEDGLYSLDTDNQSQQPLCELPVELASNFVSTDVVDYLLEVYRRESQQNETV